MSSPELLGVSNPLHPINAGQYSVRASRGIEETPPLQAPIATNRHTHPHRDRARLLLKDHPELRALIGHCPSTAGVIVAVVALQTGIAVAVGDLAWWMILIVAYVAGAAVALSLWALLHECTHDLVLRTSNANRWLGMLTGLPLIVPAASSFRTCHLLHHRHQGDPVLDGDIASGWEARLVGNCPIKKAMWLLLGALMQGLRPSRMQGIAIFDRWFVQNVLLQLLFSGLLVATVGWGSLAYCLFSNVFALGLHPLGARWIQEHFVLTPGQETYSYYGPMNRFVFNAGYHVEHHDLMRIPWQHLPAVRRIAPEYYVGLQSYTSWTKLLFRFLLDRRIRLDQRAMRGGGII